MCISILSTVVGGVLIFTSFLSFIADAFNFGSPTNFIFFGLIGIILVFTVENTRFYVGLLAEPLLIRMIQTAKQTTIRSITTCIGLDAPLLVPNDKRVFSKQLSIMTKSKTPKTIALQDKVLQITSLYAKRRLDIVRHNIDQKLQDFKKYMYSYALSCIKQSLDLWYSYCCSHQAVQSVILATENFDTYRVVSTMATSIIIQTIRNTSQKAFLRNNVGRLTRHNCYWQHIQRIISASNIPTFHKLSHALKLAETSKTVDDCILAAYKASIVLVCIYAYRLNQPLKNCRWIQTIWMQRLQQRSHNDIFAV